MKLILLVKKQNEKKGKCFNSTGPKQCHNSSKGIVD